MLAKTVLAHARASETSEAARFNEGWQSAKPSGGGSNVSAPWANREQQQRAPSLEEVQKEEEERSRVAAEKAMAEQRSMGRGRAAATKATPMSFLEIQKAEEAARKQQQKSQPEMGVSPWAMAAAKGAKQSGFVAQPAPSATTLGGAGAWGNGPRPSQASDPRPVAEAQPGAASRASLAGESGKKSGSQEDRGDTFWDYDGGQASSKTTSSRSAVSQEGPETSTFQEWCEQELRDYESSFDVKTFVTFLQALPDDEVHQYVKEYLGDSKKAHAFAVAFAERRAGAGSGDQSGSGWLTAGTKTKGKGYSQPSSQFQEVQSKNKRKKKRGQKVDPSLLTYGVNSSGGANRGEIDTWQ